MSIRHWLRENSEDLAAVVFVAVMVAFAVGFRRRSTGIAIFLSGFSGAIVAGVAYPIANSYGYDWRFGIAIIAPVAGACSWAIFGVLVSLSDRIEARKEQLADKIVDRVEKLP